MTTLEAELLAAHARSDHTALIALYAQAANTAATPDSAAFFLTHAYVFALETGHADAPALHQRLIDAGRDHPLHPPRPPKR